MGGGMVSHGATDNLVVYDYDGNRLWSSGDELKDTAYTSAPIVYESGDVVACDHEKIIKFDGSGQILWQSGISSFR